MKFQNRRVSYWIPIAILMVLMSLMLVYCQSQQNLNVYTGEPTLATDTAGNPIAGTPTTKPTSKIELLPYKHETLNLTYGIPEGWQKVIMNGCVTYVHAPSSASVQLQVLNYVPYYISTNADTMKNQMINSGYTLENFQWTTSTSYTCIYHKGDTKSGTVYVELVSFDKEHAVHFVLSWPMKYYERLLDDMLAIADSFKWEKEKPYPSSVALVYNTTAKCEFGYPVGWNTQIQNNVYLAQNPKTKSLMTVAINPSNIQYEKMTKIDYVNWASANRPGFSLIDVTMDKTTIYGISTYTANNTSVVLVHYMFASGAYEYVITFEIPYAVYEQEKDLISTVINTLKIYP